MVEFRASGHSILVFLPGRVSKILHHWALLKDMSSAESLYCNPFSGLIMLIS